MNRAKGKSWKVYRIIGMLLSVNLSLSPASSADLEDADKLTSDLSHEDFKTREAALAQLWKMADKSLPALRKTLAGKNPEAAARAEELLLYITIGLSHDSSEEAKALVMEYAEAEKKNQFSILKKLAEQGYWRQTLKLIKRIELEKIDTNTLSLAHSLAEHHARTSIISGDPAEAERVLMMTPDSLRSYLLRAWFYKYLDNEELDHQLAESAATKGLKAAEWRMALHSVDGNTAAALAEAKSAGNHEMVNILQVFEGDAKPWLTEELKNPQISAEITTGWKIQLQRLKGNQEQADALADTILREAGENLTEGDDSTLLITCLAANGYQGYALNILEKNHPESASGYYNIIDDPLTSLAALGIPAGAVAPYRDWISEVTAEALKDEDYEKLLTLAAFHAYQGEHEHIMGVMSPVMTELEKEASDDWYKLINHLASNSMGELALRFLEKRGNENNEADYGIARFLTQNKEGELADWQQTMWSCIKKRNPDDIAKSFHEIALLSGKISDLTGGTTKLHNELTEAAGDLPDAEKKELFDSLYNFARARNNYLLVNQMTEGFAEKDPAWDKAVSFFDMAFQRWSKVEARLAKQVEEHPRNYGYWADWYVCLRKLGKDAEASSVYRKMLLITMMDGNALNNIATNIHEAGYDAEALTLWQMVIIRSPEIDAQAAGAIYKMNSNGGHYYHTNQWAKAAAIKEVYLQMSMRGSVDVDNFSHYLNTRFYADFCHGMALYQQGARKEGIAILNKCRKLASGGALADDFFPALCRIDIGDRYERWFEESYLKIAAACELYPKAHNTQNTAAWLASRSVLKLDEGLKHAEVATGLKPTQGAYLDTMAEIWFAKGDREKAIEWSEKATKAILSRAQGAPMSGKAVFANYKMLKKQQDHFRNDPLPRLYSAGND